jgi:predicted polyphosphate/ATP-dependent NAD kinase
LRLHLHELIVGKFYQQESMTQRDLANRIGKTPDVVNRLLGAPGNWTLDTVSDLLIAMAAVPAIDIDDVETLLARKSDEKEIAEMLDKRQKQPAVIIPSPNTKESEKQGRNNLL